MNSRRSFLATTTAALVPLAATMVRADSPASRIVTPISINLTSAQPDVLPFFYALSQKLFERADLDITYQAVASGSLALTAVLAGAVNIGFGNPYSIITAFAKGAPVQFIAPANDSATTATDLFVLPESPIREPRDLEGRVLAVTGLHDLGSIGVRAWVDANGGDSTKVHFVEVPPSAFIASIQTKRVDAACFFEPFRTEAARIGLRSVGHPYGAIAQRFLVGAWFGQRDWFARNHAAALIFADTIRVASAYANAHYDELIPLISSFTKMDPDVIRRANRPHFAATVTPANVQPLIDVAAKYKEISAPFRAEDITVSASG